MNVHTGVSLTLKLDAGISEAAAQPVGVHRHLSLKLPDSKVLHSPSTCQPACCCCTACKSPRQHKRHPPAPHMCPDATVNTWIVSRSSSAPASASRRAGAPPLPLPPPRQAETRSHRDPLEPSSVNGGQAGRVLAGRWLSGSGSLQTAQEVVETHGIWVAQWTPKA